MENGICLAAFAQTIQRSGTARTLRCGVQRITTGGYLGVGVEELTDDRVKALSLRDKQGVEVKRVDESSPAAKAGLKENDVILEVNGKGVEGIEQFQIAIGETPRRARR